VREGFGVAGNDMHELAVAVLRRGGQAPAVGQQWTKGTERFLCDLAARLAVVLSAQERDVNVVARAKQVAVDAARDIHPIDAPGALLAVAHWTPLPAGTIAEMHREARHRLAKSLVPFNSRILHSWCDAEMLVDLGESVPT